MSAFTPGQSVQVSDLASLSLVLRVRSVEGNVLELEAFDGSFYGYRHVSSVAPVCTLPAETSVPPLGAGVVAHSSVGGGECSRSVERLDSLRSAATCAEWRLRYAATRLIGRGC